QNEVQNQLGKIIKILPSARLSTRWEVVDFEQYVEDDRLADGHLGDAAVVSEGDAFRIALPLNADTSISDTPSLAGRLQHLSPLGDGTGRFLVSWSPCRVLDPEVLAANSEAVSEAVSEGTASIRTLPCTESLLANPDVVEADPLFSLWITDTDGINRLPLVLVEAGEMISEAIAVSDAMSPMSAVPDSTRDAALQAAQLGVLDIRSVYDFDGQDTTTLGITALADAAQTTVADRPARFVRLEKTVPLPSDEVLRIENSAFGRSATQLMREIIGYAPVEPDGSVRVVVPANVAFTLSVLDADGRRIGGRHQNWLQVQSGETLLCQGCHEANSEVPHGRRDALPASAYAGAEADGPFPNSVSDLSALLGETMAQTRARVQGNALPTLGLVYEDIWTDAAVRTPDPALQISYDALTTPSPLTNSCADGWDNLCRILIHYEQHIHPLWAVDRQILDGEGALVVDNTCTSCHSPMDAMSQAQVPAGQLDLSDGPSAAEPDHLKSYRELLFGDNEQEVVDGVLVDRRIPVVDGNGNPVFETDAAGDVLVDADGNPVPLLQTVGVSPSIVVSGARDSRFFKIFSTRVVGEDAAAEVGTVDHRNMLSDAELKLLSEWVDVGAQYYNDPFAVPTQ
ncbi:MAG: hypothetical protein P8176_11945, partial [Gammaproteobacteria bacterium]